MVPFHIDDLFFTKDLDIEESISKTADKQSFTITEKKIVDGMDLELEFLFGEGKFNYRHENI